MKKMTYEEKVAALWERVNSDADDINPLTAFIATADSHDLSKDEVLEMSEFALKYDEDESRWDGVITAPLVGMMSAAWFAGMLKKAPHAAVILDIDRKLVYVPNNADTISEMEKAGKENLSVFDALSRCYREKRKNKE